MPDNTRSGPVPWRFVALALLPGLIDLLLTLVRITMTAVYFTIPYELPGLINVLLATWAIGWWRKKHAFPAWGLMPVGAAAVGVAPLLITQIWRWVIIGPPGYSEWGPGLLITDFVSNLSSGLSLGLMVSAGSYGFLRYWRTNRPTRLIWGMIILPVVIALLSGGAWRAIMALYLLIASGLGLVFTREHGQHAVLVLFGVLLAWMDVLDIDYALFIYYDQVWVISLYNILWRVLVFVVAPVWLLRALLRRRVLWGSVLPIAVERAQFRLEVAQRNHIALAIRAFVRLELYRIHTGISWFEAKNSIIRSAICAYLANPEFILPSTA